MSSNLDIQRCSDSKISCIVQDDETALLQGAKEAKKMIVEAYAALLLAFLSTERFVNTSKK